MADSTLDLRVDGYSENSISFDYRDGHLNISIENPWAGSSETGFGAICDIGLPIEAAMRLRDWLTSQLGDKP